MKINAQILSIPPYISTAWDQIASLQIDMKDKNTLIVSLISGVKIIIPELEKSVMDTVFNKHAEFLEKSAQKSHNGFPFINPEQILNLNLSGPNGLGLDNPISFSGIMQHNLEQKDAPDLPKELLSKIQEMAKALGLDSQMLNLPEGEPHCNCPHCQICHAFSENTEKGSSDKKCSSDEDTVSEKDLQFKEWDIAQVGDNLYKVTNPLDEQEHYQVFLGTPVGCTCGKSDCEHVLAVLKS